MLYFQPSLMKEAFSNSDLFMIPTEHGYHGDVKTPLRYPLYVPYCDSADITSVWCIQTAITAADWVLEM